MIEYDNHLNSSKNDAASARSEQEFIFHFASEYLERGWGVIPLERAGKRPALRTWKEFQERRPTREEIAFWFRGPKPRHTNIGIVTGGISGLVGVDFDSPQAERSWLESRPHSPLMVRTGSGNAHLYYRLNPDVKVQNRVHLGGKNLDLRGDHGYLVAPPSQHPCGGLYLWASGFDDYCLDAVPEFDPAWLDLPSDLGSMPVNWCSRAAITRHAGLSSGSVIRNPRRYIHSIRSIQGEYGSNACFRVACILLRAGLTPEETLVEMQNWNLTCAEPAWSEQELRHKIADAAKRL